MATAPLLDDVVTALPCASLATLLVNSIGEEVFVVEFDTISDIVARSPFEIGTALRPHSTQVMAPALLLLHVIDLFAVSATGPAVTVAEGKSNVE
jgi:hypothetical protein